MAIASGGLLGTFVSSRYSGMRPDVDPPHAHGDVDVGERDGDLHAGRLQAERVGVDALVAFLLPALAVELLVEVPLRVEQSDTDERDAEVRRRLEVVAGEHAEARPSTAAAPR